MAIEQANAEATRARQDRIAEAEIEAIRNGRHAGATTLGGTNDSGETPPVDTALQGLYKKFPGLKRDLIKSIRQSKFIPRMLFKLRYAQGVNADRLFTLDRVPEQISSSYHDLRCTTRVQYIVAPTCPHVVFNMG